ncbi:MAG: ParA family protein [Ruminococcaceae bacterium]|nr:ParA family protein [Oscillospiraceae bacterium]
MQKSKRIKIICGHYGSGKTNVAVNLALLYKKRYPSAKVALADVDTVNPYFRAADNAKELESAGIHPILPEFANTNVDIPSLPAELYSIFSPDSDTVSFIDVGGDDGAAALGMYSDLIKECGYEMIYVVSKYRPLISDPSAAADLMHIIEEASHLKCTSVVNNSSIGAETTKEDILASLEYAHKVSEECSLPLLFTSYYKDLIGEIRAEGERFFPMKNVTKQIF